MPDQRSVMKEYRYLDEKRLAEGLTPAEQARLEKLRVLVGPESGAGGLTPGFDVNAAAAALRESLLPAGLRNRPPPTPAHAPPEPEPAPEPAATLQDALASEYAESPFAPLDVAPAEQPQDALFDPSSLGTEPPPHDPTAQAYDPAQPYDPDAQPYDPGAQGYDPNQPYDPNAQAYDPNQPYDPNAQAYDPNQPYDPSAQAYDPNQPYDPSAQAYDPNQPYDPSAQAYDPNQPYDPSAPQQAWDPAQPWDPNAAPPEAPYPAGAVADQSAPQQAWDQAQPWDPTAAPAEGAAGEPGAYADAAYGAGAPVPQAWGAGAAQEPAEDASGEEITDLAADELTEVEPTPGEAAPPEGGSFSLGEEEAAPGWDAAEVAAPAPPHDAAFGEYDAAGPVEPFGPGSLGAEPPLDASAFGERLAEEAPPAAAPELGEYDDTAGFAAEPFEASSVAPDAPGLDAGAAPELDASWQPEAALDAGFELASGGSFGAGADAAAPEWAQSSAPPPWEGTPALDLDAPPAPQASEEQAEYELSPAPTSESFAPAAAADLFGAPEEDLAAPAEEGLDAGGAAPELDFSRPDFSGGEEAGEAATGADLASGSFADTSGAPELDDVSATAPLDLGQAPEAHPAEDAGPPADLLDFGAEPGLPELPPAAEAPPIPELTLPPEETILEATDVIEELPPGELAAAEAAPDLAGVEAAPDFAGPEAAADFTAPEAAPDFAAPEAAADFTAPEAAPDFAAPEAAPDFAAAEAAPDFAAPEAAPDFAAAEAAPGAVPSDDVMQFAEAAAAAVASESTDLAEMIEAPPGVLGEPPPPVDDFSFDVAEEPPVDLGSGEPSFDAATAIAGAGADAVAPATDDLAPPAEDAGPLQPLPSEAPPDVLSFDLAEEPAVEEPPPTEAATRADAPSDFEAALAAAPSGQAGLLADEELPTIDGADILEEIVEDGAAAAPPPQSLDFEPLEPEPPVAPPTPAAVAPPPAAVVPPPAAAVAPPPAATASPKVLAPPAAVAPPATVIAPPPPAPASAAPPPAAQPADTRVPGSHRVVVHTVEGLVKRGVLEDPELARPALALAPQPGANLEEITTDKVKAIFFMLSPGEKAPAAEGKRVRVTFRDGRQIAGFSPDYRDEGVGFFMIPADTKTNTGRIWVYRAAVRQVAVS